MDSTSTPSVYTLRFSCTSSITIPCSLSSKDVGKTYSIDKPCAQCAPHPHLQPVIYDQGHWDAVQSQNGTHLSTEKVSTRRDGEIASDNASPIASSSKSSPPKASTKAALKKGLRKMKSAFMGDNKVVPQKNESIEYFLSATRATLAEEIEKRMEIGRKIEEIEWEIVMEKVMKLERRLYGES